MTEDTSFIESIKPEKVAKDPLMWLYRVMMLGLLAWTAQTTNSNANRLTVIETKMELRQEEATRQISDVTGRLDKLEAIVSTISRNNPAK
jgi:hypothetical protein